MNDLNCDLNEIYISFSEFYNNDIGDNKHDIISNVDNYYDIIFSDIDNDTKLNITYFYIYIKSLNDSSVSILRGGKKIRRNRNKNKFKFGNIYNEIIKLCPNINNYCKILNNSKKKYGGVINDEGKKLLKILYLYDSNHDFGKQKKSFLYKYIEDNFHNKLQSLIPAPKIDYNNLFYNGGNTNIKGFEAKIVDYVYNENFFNDLLKNNSSCLVIDLNNDSKIDGLNPTDKNSLIQIIQKHLGIKIDNIANHDEINKFSIIDTTLFVNKLDTIIKGGNKKISTTDTFYNKFGHKLEPFENAFDPHSSSTITIDNAQIYERYKTILNKNFNNDGNLIPIDDEYKYSIRNIIQKYFSFHIYDFNFIPALNNHYFPCIELKLFKNNDQDYKNTFRDYIKKFIHTTLNDLTTTSNETYRIKNRNKPLDTTKEDGFLYYKDNKVYIYYHISFNQINNLKYVIDKIFKELYKDNNYTDLNKIHIFLNNSISKDNNVLNIIVIYLFLTIRDDQTQPYNSTNINNIIDILLDLKKAGDWGQSLFCSRFNNIKNSTENECLFISGDQLSAIRSVLCENVDTIFSSQKKLYVFRKNSKINSLLGGTVDDVLDTEIIYNNINNLLNFSIFKNFFNYTNFYEWYNNIDNNYPNSSIYQTIIFTHLKDIYIFFANLSKYIFIAFFIKSYDFYDKLKNIINKAIQENNLNFTDVHKLKELIDEIQKDYTHSITTTTEQNESGKIKYIHNYIQGLISNNIETNFKTFNYSYLLNFYKLYYIYYCTDSLYKPDNIVINNILLNSYSNIINFLNKLYHTNKKYFTSSTTISTLNNNNNLRFFKKTIQSLQYRYLNNNEEIDLLDLEYNNFVINKLLNINSYIIKCINNYQESLQEFNDNYISLQDNELYIIIKKISGNDDDKTVGNVINYINLLNETNNELQIKVDSDINILKHHQSIKDQLKEDQSIKDQLKEDQLNKNKLKERRSNRLYQPYDKRTGGFSTSVNIKQIKNNCYYISVLYNKCLKYYIDQIIISHHKSIIDTNYELLLNNIKEIISSIIEINEFKLNHIIKDDIILNEINKNKTFISQILSRSEYEDNIKEVIYKFYIHNIYIIILNYLKINNSLYEYFKRNDINNDVIKEFYDLKFIYINNLFYDTNYENLDNLLSIFYNCFKDFYTGIGINNRININEELLQNIQYDVIFNNF